MALVRGACMLLCIVFHICLARLWSTDLVFISTQGCEPKSVIRDKILFLSGFRFGSALLGNITVQCHRLQVRPSQGEWKLSPDQLFPCFHLNLVL